MRWSYIINGKEKISLSEGGCHFLESEITSVETRTTEQEIAGRDGVLIGSNTFDSFELVLKFYYEGIDNKDVLLFVEKIKKIIHARNAMYVVHSQMPGRKYAFNSAKIGDFETISNSDATFTITFNCFKGYSESLRDTDDMKLLQENVQFEQGLVLSEKLQYKHKTKSFKIYNGSTDVIDPLMQHKLIIQMSVEAPNGFKIRNKTTGDLFEYKKKIKKSQDFILNGVYPYVDKKRVGVDTNYSYMTLAPGENNIVIEGDGVEKIDIKFIFNFIYR